VAEAVVGGALLPVLQDVIGLVDLLELMLAFLVAGIAVGMPLHRELAIGGLHLRLGRVRITQGLRLVVALAIRRSPK
jgi:putative exporter of polyketide antibiotics